MIHDQKTFDMEVTRYQPWQIVRMLPETCPALAAQVIETFYRRIPSIINAPDQIGKILCRAPETYENDTILNRKAWRIDLDNRSSKRPDEAVYLVWSDSNGLWIEATMTTTGAILFEAISAFLRLAETSGIVPEGTDVL